MSTYSLWRSGFRMWDCKGALDADATPEGVGTGISIVRPRGMEFWYQWLLSGLDAKLWLPLAGKPDELILDRFINRPAITYLDQYADKWPSHPFIIWNGVRSLLVTFKQEPLGRPAKWSKANAVSIDARFDALSDWVPDAASSVAPVHDVVATSAGTDVRTKSASTTNAPLRLLSSVAKTYAVDAAPVVSEMPLAARAEVTYAAEGGSTTKFTAGSDSDRVMTVRQTMTVPAVAVPPKDEKVVPHKQVMVDRYLFEAFSHPYVCSVVRQLHRYGVDGLLDPAVTSVVTDFRRQATKANYFSTEYVPDDNKVAKPYPVDDFDFSYGGAFSAYNWELFFHIPIHIALRLVADQRFEESLRWFHAVFHPMERAVPSEMLPSRVWKIRPFFKTDVPADIDDLLGSLSYGGDDPKLLEQQKQVQHQIDVMRAHPFEPHRLARLRTPAYQRFVVIKYVEMLIAWGDQLFRRETLESLNEALQLYVLASNILGRRPERVEKPAPTPSTSVTFNSLVAATTLDDFANAVISVEAMTTELAIDSAGSASTDSMPFGGTFAFCIPPNEKLLGLWDLVEDRLFKIRHCMNIEGVVRQLPLFEPPIDPALLVRARALGLDISSVLNDVNSPPPIRRFRFLVAKAQELCGELKALSGSLLAALEKRDAEALGRIRARQERDILDMTRAVREAQVREAEEALGGLKESLSAAQKRQSHYIGLLEEGALPAEVAQQAALVAAGLLHATAQVIHGTAAPAALLPQGTAGSPGIAVTTFGGEQVHRSTVSTATALEVGGSVLQTGAGLLAYSALNTRREEDWELQRDLAAIDIRQIERQIVAQEIRRDIAVRELRIHDRQVANARETEDFLKEKYTNKELYDWMVSQLSALYFQFYKLAFDTAKRAERAFRFERAEPSRSFVNFGAWESLRKGLLAGERLSLDLRRMEAAYLNEEKRDLELVKHVSLAMLKPDELLKLRETGSCQFTIPELLFDMDTPGHYLRRIRSMSVTLPSVSGPYVPVRLTVTHKSSEIRVRPDLNVDSVVRSDVAVQAVVTSHGRDDGGVFEMDPRDERYLPFEGAGVSATISVALPTQFRAFDYRTIQDLVLHVRYTARDGGTAFRDAVVGDVTGKVGTASTGDGKRPLLLISLKRDLPDAWRQLIQAPMLPPAWQNARAYVVGDRVTSNSNIYECTTAGTSASAPTGTGTSISDGPDLRWKYLRGVDSRSIDVPLRRDRFPFGFFDKLITTKALTIASVIGAATYPTGSGSGTIKIEITKPGSTTADPTVLEIATTTPYGGLPATAPRAIEQQLSSTAYNLNLLVKDIGAVDSLETGTPPRFDPTKLLDLILVVEYAVS